MTSTAIIYTVTLNRIKSRPGGARNPLSSNISAASRTENRKKIPGGETRDWDVWFLRQVLSNARGFDECRSRSWASVRSRGGPGGRSLRGPHQTALAALNAFDSFLFLDSPALSLGEIVIVASQNGLYIFLKVFAELAYFFLYAFFRFRLHTHQIFTCLSGKPLSEAENDWPGAGPDRTVPSPWISIHAEPLKPQARRARQASAWLRLTCWRSTGKCSSSGYAKSAW